MKQVVSFGGGTNSTALIIEMQRRDEQIDAITFSDTGGEKPNTYAYISVKNDWLRYKNLPQIEVLAANSKHKTLENECLTLGVMPSVVFGKKTCSDKWKIQPFRNWLKKQEWTDVVACIGYDADEAHRATKGADAKEKYVRRFPLIEWDMGREECIAVIRGAGLPLPGKSACFFCPNSRSHEILGLPADLRQRALTIEKNAMGSGKVQSPAIKGLGRRASWEGIIQGDADQYKLLLGGADQPCGCYDGE